MVIIIYQQSLIYEFFKFYFFVEINEKMYLFADANECDVSPCVNAISCKNLIGNYECTCLPGWDGKNCDRNLNDCVGQCLNGATCIDLVNDYHCACLPGFTGRECQTNINECASNPCLNGGECVDLIADYRCICAVGYKGYRCEVSCL